MNELVVVIVGMFIAGVLLRLLDRTVAAIEARLAKSRAAKVKQDGM
jgi:hypothetical protein